MKDIFEALIKFRNPALNKSPLKNDIFDYLNF